MTEIQYQTRIRTAPARAPPGLAYNFEGGTYTTEPQPRNERPQEESKILDFDSIR